MNLQDPTLQDSNPSCVRPRRNAVHQIFLRCVLGAAEAIAGTCVGLLMNNQCHDSPGSIIGRLNFGREEG